MRRKSGRSSHGAGGTPAMQVAKGKPQAAMRGSVNKSPSEMLGLGKPVGVRSGARSRTPAESASLGKAQARTTGLTSRSLAVGRPTAKRSGNAKDIALGKPQAKTSPAMNRTRSAGRAVDKCYRTGGSVDMGFEPKDERLRIARKRDAILEQPAFKDGGEITMRQIYEKLHSHFGNDAPMKRLRAKKSEMTDALPAHLPAGKKRLARAGGGGTNPYEAEAAREQKYWEDYSATHNPADKYEDVDKSSLAGLTDKLAGAGNDYGKQYQSGYDKFVEADQSKSNAIRNQSINTPMGNGKPGFDVQAMRDRAAAKAAGRAAPQVDRRGDAYKAAADAQNNAYREQSMKETQQDKRRSGAFNSEMHDQRVKRNSDMQAADLTRHGYKQGADGNWNRSVWDAMKDSNPTLTKAFGWIPGAKEFTEAGAKGDVGGMINAGKQAMSGAQGMADTASGYMDKAKPYVDKARSMTGLKKGGPARRRPTGQR